MDYPETPTTLPVNVAAWAVRAASKRRRGAFLLLVGVNLLAQFLGLCLGFDDLHES
jgi:hypothetical protein